MTIPHENIFNYLGLTPLHLRPGAHSGGSIGAVVPHTTYESSFIRHNFIQFGKQHSRYKAILPYIVLYNSVVTYILHLS